MFFEIKPDGEGMYLDENNELQETKPHGYSVNPGGFVFFQVGMILAKAIGVFSWPWWAVFAPSLVLVFAAIIGVWIANLLDK